MIREFERSEDFEIPFEEFEEYMARVRRDESMDNEAKRQLQEEMGFTIGELIGV